jgi:hypothetical protein
MKTTVLSLLTVAIAATCGTAATGSTQAHKPGTTVQQLGLSISVPEGWQARIYQLSPDDAITLEAASVALPTPGEPIIGEHFGMNDVYLRIDDIGPAQKAWGESSLPISVGPQDIWGPYEGGFPAGAAFSANINGRELMVRVRFGSEATSQQLELINPVLRTFSAAPLAPQPR